MYGIVRPKDLIGNYKLPIEVRGLHDFWGNKIAERIIAENPDYIINLLPKAYEKLLKIRENLGQLKERNIKILNMIFVSKILTQYQSFARKIFEKCSRKYARKFFRIHSI